MAGNQEIKRPLLAAAKNGATLDGLHVMVSRVDLEKEHSLLIARLHILRRQLGYTPLTQKEQRRKANE